MLLCVLAILIAIPACQKSNDNPDDDTTPEGDTTTTPPDNINPVLILNETDIVIGIDETKKLTVRSSLTGMETSGVLWISDNPSVAKVDTSGLVTGVSDGAAIITVSAIDGSAEAQCAVTVTSNVTDVNIIDEKIVLEVGDPKELEYEIIPANASNKNVTWESRDESVVTVSQNGVIQAVGTGTTDVFVITEDGDKYDYCKVTVVIYIKSITIEKSDLKLNKGVDYRLCDEVVIDPANATETKLTWESKDEEIVRVSADGIITAVSAGTTRITVKTENGFSAVCYVTVHSPVSSVNISKPEIKLKQGEEEQLTATVLPLDASDKFVTWSSSNPNVAIVTPDGKVIAVKASSEPVVITVRTNEGAKTASCIVTVVNPLNSIIFDKTTLNLTIYDEPVTIIPTFSPLDADDIATLRWTSNNPKAATVDANGVVTPVGDGIATITLSNENGVYATCEVTVQTTLKPVESIKVEMGFVTLKPGQKHTPIVTVLPEDAGNKTYIIESEDGSVVRVNEDGTITAVSIGMIRITVKSVLNPEVSDEFWVKVEEMTEDEKNSAIAKYNEALTSENNRYLAAIDAINVRYAYLTNLKKELDSYETQKAAIEKNLNDYRALLSDAQNANNQELIAQYSDLIAQENDKLKKLEEEFVDYPELLQMYTERNAEYNAEIAAENQLNVDNIAKINSEFEYILPYLPAT